jgi:DNA-binding transcriptional ArsR family regulator
MSEFEEQQKRLDEFAVALRQMAEQEEAELFDLEKRIKAKRQNVGRIYRAIRELTGENERAKTKKKVEAKKAVTPKPESIQKVRAAFDAQPEDGFTHEAIMEATGLSHDTVRRSIGYLRDTEVVRRAEVDPQTRKHYYRLMPEFVNA